jgi:hypothetical protein
MMFRLDIPEIRGKQSPPHRLPALNLVYDANSQLPSTRKASFLLERHASRGARRTTFRLICRCAHVHYRTSA